MLKKGLFNIPHQLSNRSFSEKNEIKNTLLSAINLSREEGIDVAATKLTQGLIPYYFREARPYTALGNAVPAIISSYARPEKYAHITKLLNVFSWLFLTNQDIIDQQRVIRSLYPDLRQRDVRCLMRKQQLSHCYS